MDTERKGLAGELRGRLWMPGKKAEIKTTFELVKIISDAVPAAYREATPKDGQADYTLPPGHSRRYG